MTKAPLGQESTGNNPTDRAKSGTKRFILTDASSIPVGVAIAGANVQDIRLLRETLLNSLSRYEIINDRDPENLCLDRGYDSKAIRDMLQSMGYVAHNRSRGEEHCTLGKDLFAMQG